MTDNKEIDDLAAEYVLGTLSHEERLACQKKMEREPALAQAVADYEQKLAPLQELVPPMPPSPDTLAGIFAKIDASSAGEQLAPEKKQRFDLEVLQEKLRYWRMLAFGASLMAASLMVFIGLKAFYPVAGRMPQAQYIAVLQSKEKNPQFVASVDLKRGVVDIVRIGAFPQAGKSYELWALGGGRKKPVSLGLVSKPSLPAQKLKQQTAAPLDKTVFAISLEPEGGSPTGQPTGPVLFTGKLYQTR